MRRVLLLGASGSIGSQTLDVLKADPKSFLLTGFSVGLHIEKIPSILASFPFVNHICVEREEDVATLKISYPAIHFYFGDEGLKELIEEVDCDMVVNALVGFAGLVPSITALNHDKILCLANKESLVVGGSFINRILKQGHGKLYPIDSEHVALAKLLSRVNRDDVDKLVITASGGSFRNLSRSELSNVTPAMALKHPTWKMGGKITIDSATMMNKGFEVIEAKWLYDFPLQRTEILMHDESHVHSLLLMKDGSYYADISEPDMHTPIKWALYESNVEFNVFHEKDLAAFGPYHFHKFDPARYPAVGLALKAYQEGGLKTTILNAANEVAVYAFLKGEIPFLSIEHEVQYALDHLPNNYTPSLHDVLSMDALTRIAVQRHIESKGK
ncbi:MAG: 1-deoxy-D-xylulose 5-phosphate reductoisomerase [Tenericutes bacterium ADurb.BinA155]|jgi:1-deoxy-D-xylulose-5-phosphate reductoisomerase|nr:MAG: 1-deoxy-D-xylulose 5-phosphate reductoisomerase [Tenericutes bacterium ADurb.BinA155]